MVVPERPLSLQAKSKAHKDRYKNLLSEKAKQEFSDRKIFITDLYIKIIWCHRLRPEQDIDNILKPILDSLKEVIYRDDKIICQCHLYRIDLRRNPEIISTEDMDVEIIKTTTDMQNLIKQPDNNHILYIEVGNVSEMKIVPGPVEVN
jgi:Holliday junction resolvase RusA-like endonuclease